jgi:PAS domain S-box-containing protein
MAEKPTYEELERRVQELEKIESEYKSSKEALQKTENLFKLLYEKAPLGYQSLDENGHFIVVNQTWLDTFGYTREEVVGKSFADFLHPEWREHFKENFPRFKSIGEILGVEFEMVKKNGDHILVSFTGKISRDEKGTFQQTHCIFHDSTDRKKYKESLERYKDIVSSTTDAIAYLDENYRYVIVNNAYEDFSGATRNDFVGMTVAEYLGKDVFEEKIKLNLDRCLNGEIINYQEWFEYPTKGKRFVDVTYFPYRNGKNHISGVIANTRDITDRKKVEEALNREHKMLARTEAVAHVGSWEWEAEGDKVTWSEELFRIFGLEPMQEAPPFTEHQAFYVPEDRVRLVEAVEECLRNSVPYDLEVRVIRTDGELRHCVVRGFPEHGTDGSVNRLYGSLHDITERKRMEEAMQESESQISSIFRSAPVGIGSVVNRALIKVNNRLCEMTGYDETDLIGQSSRMLYPCDEDFEFVGREKYAQIADHGTGMVETRWQKKDGTIMDVILSSTPVDLKDHSKGVTFTALDITERKQTERALVEQKDLLAAIYRNAPLVIMVVNAERRIQQVNGFAAQFVGRDAEEMLGLRSGEALRCMHVLDDPRGCGFGEFCQQCVIRNTVIDTLETGKTHLQIEAPYYFRGQDNETRDLQFFMSTTSIEVKGERMVLVTLQDITERQQAEAEKEKLQAQLAQAQKMESVGRLAGGVAHDYNNMLGVILGHTELALLKTDEDNDLVSDLKEIQKAAKRSADITKQLLAFARKEIISPKQIDLNDTVESMLNMLRRLIGEDIDLVWQPGANLWSVKMDPIQIDQILANLCVNARDAITGVGKLTIETGKKTFDEEYCKEHPGFIPGDFVLLAVSDNGCGMDKEILENLFEPFFTTKEVGKGTGLGLATIYGIVKQNHGFINVYSEPGQGSTFKIYLPRLVAEENDDKAVPEKKAATGGTETILLVEDEPTILRMTQMMLERKGYSVLPAATPVEAIDLAKAHADKIHLLMTDVVMPEMNGRDLAGQITALFPDIQLLFMSGYTSNVIAHHGVLDDGWHLFKSLFQWRR